MSKRWDFAPEPIQPIHQRIAAGAIEKELLQELGKPENSDDLQAILAAARALTQASIEYVSRKVNQRESIDYFAIRIASGAVRKAMRTALKLKP